MRDRSPYRDEPGNWSDAFNRLPLESPEGDTWARLAPEIRPPVRRARRMARWASAAAMAALAIAVPISWIVRNQSQEASPLAAHAPPPAASHAVTPESDQTPTVHAADRSPDTAAQLPPQAGQSAVDTSEATVRDHPTSIATRIASIAGDHGTTVSKPIPTADTAAIRQESLPALYAESAQLEALLAQVQDERVSSGPEAALAAQFESQLASIDVSLSDPALSDDLRTALWGERVDALRELVAFKATQRWLNARGERYDGQLVAVY